MDTKAVVALRGFGLAMIDNMRGLTIGRGGSFEVVDELTQRMRYIKSGDEPKQILPFSLDGLPLSPKPVNQMVDKWFLPTDSGIGHFETKIKDSAQEGDATDLNFLIDAIAPIIARIFKRLGDKAQTSTLNSEEITTVIKSWLLDETYEHRLIIPKSNPPEKSAADFIGMATGTKSISLDYCIGQVWRHCETYIIQFNVIFKS